MDQVQFDHQLRNRVLSALEKAIVENFQEHDWKEFGYFTGQQDFVRSHRRLLRSLSWQDEDQAGKALTGCLVGIGTKRGPCACSAPAADFSERGCSAYFGLTRKVCW
ncbi:hypothetical protein [Stenotrophomonas maltophilia]|uniref:hypothetical protein n=1 Tax=Stenotrophomonas maltophilia TaxID=40324 RepID=UPI001C992F9D